MSSLDLDTATMSDTEASLDTEEIFTMRVLDGALHVPYMDPRSNDDPSTGQLAATTGDGTWGVVTSCDSPVPVHVFDVAKTDDGLWLFGSADAPDAPGDPNSGAGTIWRSTDDGATWTESLSVVGGGFARIYAACQFTDGNVIAFYIENEIGSPAHAYRWTPGGTEWVEVAITDVLSAARFVTDCNAGFTIRGREFWVGAQQSKSSAIVAASPPVIITHPDHPEHRAVLTSALPNGNLYDAVTAGGFLWLLASDMTVYRVSSFAAVTAVCVLDDDTSRSMAVDPDGGFLYFGTTDSRILRTPMP